MRPFLVLCGLGAVAAALSAAPPSLSRLKPSTHTVIKIWGATNGERFKFIGDSMWKGMDFVVAGKSPVALQVNVPAFEGLHKLSWTSTLGKTLTVQYEVTCSDGNPCNGQELWVGGRCRNAPRPLCDDLDPCTTDTCEPGTGICTNKRNLARPGCASSVACYENCEPNCVDSECGSDQCGGTCGTCSGSERCNATKCVACEGGDCSAIVGSCGSPDDTLTALFSANGWQGNFFVNGDNSRGIDQVRPTCNPTSPAGETIYLIRNRDQYTGMEIRMISQPGTVPEGEAPLDTLLELFEIPFGNTSYTDVCLDHNPRYVKACSDDSYPPGDAQSRVTYTMKPLHDYFVIADAYALEQTGPFQLQFTLESSGRTPQCESRFCGDNGCGSPCGDCGEEKCINITDFSTRCIPDPCTRQCNGRVCGDDQCGGTCGNCSGTNILCVDETGTCEFFEPCNPLVPICHYTQISNEKNGNGKGKAAVITRQGCNATTYCASDCQCHPLDEKLPDIIMDGEQVAPFQAEVDVPEGSCIVAEGYATAGKHKMIKFATNVGNQGRAPYAAPPSASHPELFVWAPCHGHYHFRQFIQWKLFNGSGHEVHANSKFSYCIEDSYPMHKKEGLLVPCSGSSDCENQGLAVGWFDTYPATVDGQFIVVDDLPPGHYTIQQCANVNRRIVELTLENNCIRTPFELKPWDQIPSDD